MCEWGDELQRFVPVRVLLEALSKILPIETVVSAVSGKPRDKPGVKTLYTNRAWAGGSARLQNEASCGDAKPALPDQILDLAQADGSRVELFGCAARSDTCSNNGKYDSVEDWQIVVVEWAVQEDGFGEGLPIRLHPSTSARPRDSRGV